MARYRTNMAELLKKVHEDGHEDVSSSKRMCQTIIEDATQIRTKLDSMSAEDKLDTWWTNKLAKSADNLNSARDYITNPIEESLELDEGRMKTIYTMQQQGKSAAEIAKYMKLPVKTIKDILGEEEDFEEDFLNSNSVKALYDKTDSQSDDPMTIVFRAGAKFLIENKNQAANVLSEKVKRVMDVAIDKEVEKYENKLTFLATVGSVAPFIGLFGTVWGIMNSFQSIAISRNTSLAIVAPGIAEALFATALGLLAAIPAVVAYNKFTSSSRKYTQKLENFTQSFLSIM